MKQKNSAWDQEEADIVKELSSRGISDAEISREHLPHRTAAAIAMFRKRYGIIKQKKPKIII